DDVGERDRAERSQRRGGEPRDLHRPTTNPTKSGPARRTAAVRAGSGTLASHVTCARWRPRSTFTALTPGTATSWPRTRATQSEHTIPPTSSETTRVPPAAVRCVWTERPHALTT